MCSPLTTVLSRHGADGFYAAHSTVASSAASAAAPFALAEFGGPTELTYLTTSIFILGYVPGPILWGPFSEAYGRRIVFVISFALYTVFMVGQARANSMATLIVTRFFAGVFACSPFAAGIGFVVDVWSPAVRGTALSLVILGVCFGPVLGPLIGSL
jgi:MFS transporter, DHA1 family, multidrug resistance protein